MMVCCTMGFSGSGKGDEEPSAPCMNPMNCKGEHSQLTDVAVLAGAHEVCAGRVETAAENSLLVAGELYRGRLQGGGALHRGRHDVATVAILGHNHHLVWV